MTETDHFSDGQQTVAYPLTVVSPPSDEREHILTSPPDSKWDLEELAAYSLGRLRLIFEYGRRAAVEVYRLGEALSLAKRHLKKNGAYGEWLKKNDLPRTTAWEAVQLFERAGTETAIADLPLPDALRKFGVRKAREKAIANAATQPSVESRPAETEDKQAEIIEYDATGHPVEDDKPEAKADKQSKGVASTEGPFDLLLFLTKVETLVLSMHDDRHKIDWSKQDIEASKEAIENIIAAMNELASEVEEHDSLLLA